MDLELGGNDGQPPSLALDSSDAGCRLDVLSGDGPDNFQVVITVPPASPPANEGQPPDDELVFCIRDASGGSIPTCRARLRRTLCEINTALIERHRVDSPLRPQTKAALLWHSWRRFRMVVGLKRFTSGKSGSDVLVVRPQLRDPYPDERLPRGSIIPGAIAQAWGSPLLVKTGPVHKIRQEWDRFQIFLKDRQHPFMARIEDYLAVRPTNLESDAGDDKPPQATVIGSFLGGDLLQPESFEQIVKGTALVDDCVRIVERMFSVMGTWYEGSVVRRLRHWHHTFEMTEGGRLRMFGKYDFTQDADRKKYRESLAWDIAFIRKGHLRDHWLGRLSEDGQERRDGLLFRIMDWDVRYSLVHGDMHTRNILADSENIWLLDFGMTEVAPTLSDFAKLEVYLRLWCLDLAAGNKNLEDAAMELESHLLDNMTGSEATLEPVRCLAADLGADPDQLVKVTHCISAIRRQAANYGMGSPDRRDYLAVLFLTLLGAFKYVGENIRLAANYRLLVGLAWVLEDVLSRMAGMTPYARERTALDAKQLLSRQWLASPGAPARVRYLMDRPDGRQALQSLAATRGVAQNENHHLDVFDHTLLVLAYLENLFVDPVAGFLDPADLDRRIRDDLLRQGICQPEPMHPLPGGDPPDIPLQASDLDSVRRLFDEILDEEARLLLKWAALLHDVGKPATRTLKVHPKTGEETVQFLGHEVYGLQMIDEHLSTIFREKCGADGSEMQRDGDNWSCPTCHGTQPAAVTDTKARIQHIIRRHHDHHNLIQRCLDHPRWWESLKESLTSETLYRKRLSDLKGHMDPEVSPQAGDFPLLILHGFADELACRGSARKTQLRTVGAIDLVLLTLFARRRGAASSRDDEGRPCPAQ
jgi:putative nucleotidyltransferase with HDIG domain